MVTQRCRTLACCILAILLYWNVLWAMAFSLEEMITDDMFPPSSSLCTQNSSTTKTSFSFSFSNSNRSHWSPQNAAYEPLVFLVEMHHQDEDPNQTWTLRLGKGGQIYSILGAYGEAIPPQATLNAAWMDTVVQMVAVNLQRNNDTLPYFIHQAGTYMDDPSFGVPPPFYSPTLALNCIQSQCDVVSWGQQAHLPTSRRSDVLYYIRYRDCGNGVLEMTQIIHNAASDPTDVLEYLNVPWTGIRKSTFHDILLSDKNGSLHHEFPMKLYSDTTSPLPNLHDMGGFTTFAQSLPSPPNVTMDLPCISSYHDSERDCNANATERIRLLVPRNESCLFIAGLSNRLDYYIVRMDLFDYPNLGVIQGCREACGSGGLLFVNKRSGFAIHVVHVVHWIWSGRFIYFASNVTAAEINHQFVAGDEIQVVHAQGGIPLEENLALTFVHGVDREFMDPDNSWITSPTRLRHGVVMNEARDLIVYTINFIGMVKPGDTYINRQFIINGKLSGVEERARAFVSETFQDVLTFNDHNGRELTLLATNTTFGVFTANSSCANETYPECKGHSTPARDMAPLFFLRCANLSYVGFDQYYFAPPRSNETEILRPYLCHGLALEIRPLWTLLGYFPKNNCTPDSNLVYDPELC